MSYTPSILGYILNTSVIVRIYTFNIYSYFVIQKNLRIPHTYIFINIQPATLKSQIFQTQNDTNDHNGMNFKTRHNKIANTNPKTKKS